MTALSSGHRRPGLIVYLALIILATQNTHSAPIESESTHVAEYDASAGGCYYNLEHYQEGARIITNEPCLNCTCHNRMLMCYLRVCPFTKAIGQDCTVEKRPDQCCPVVTCPEVPVQLLTSTTSSPANKSITTGSSSSGSTDLGFPDTYGCSVNDRFFADGAQLPINASNPCELCYCIRNKTTCLMQQCTLSVAGCKPVYHPGICCPVKYNCDYDDSYETTTPGLIMSTSSTTTLAPRTTPPQCTHDGKMYDDGELIYTIQPCQHCYCFHGDIVCAVQECGKPMESHGKNCTALPPLDGECCPSYQCEDGTANVATELPDVTDRNEVPQEPLKESFPGDNNNIPEEVATEEPQTVSPIKGEVPEPSASESPAVTGSEEPTTVKSEDKPIESKEPHEDQVTEKAQAPNETVITTSMPTADKIAAQTSKLPPRIDGDEHRDETATSEPNVVEVSTEPKLLQTDMESTTISGAEKGDKIGSHEPEVSTGAAPEESGTTSPESTSENIPSGQADETTEKATTVSKGVDKTSEFSSPVSEVITTEQSSSKESTEATPLPSDVDLNKPSEPASETTEQTTIEPNSNKSTVESGVSDEDKSTTLSPGADDSSSTSSEEPESVESIDVGIDSESSSPSSETDEETKNVEPIATSTDTSSPSSEEPEIIEPVTAGTDSDSSSPSNEAPESAEPVTSGTDSDSSSPSSEEPESEESVTPSTDSSSLSSEGSENVEPVTTPESSTAIEPSKEEETAKESDNGASSTLSSDIGRESDKSESPIIPEVTTAEIPEENDNSVITTSSPEITTTKPSDEMVTEEVKEAIGLETSTQEDTVNEIPEETETTTLTHDSSKPKESVTIKPETTTSKNVEEDKEAAETRNPFETSTLPDIESKKPEGADETPSIAEPIGSIETEQPKTEETPLESITMQTPQEPEVSEEPIIPETGPSGIPAKPERVPENKKVDSNETLAEPEVTEGPLVIGSGMPQNVDNLQTEEPESGSTSYLPPVDSSTEGDRQSSTPVYEEPPKDNLDVEKQTTEIPITPKITYETTTVKQPEESSSEKSVEEKPSDKNESTSNTPDEETSTTKQVDSSLSTETPSETPDKSTSQKGEVVQQVTEANIPGDESTAVASVKETETSVSDEGKSSTEAPEDDKGASESPEVDEQTTGAPDIDESSEKSVSDENIMEPVTSPGVSSSESAQPVTEHQPSSSEPDATSPLTEAPQKSEGTEPATEVPIVSSEPEVTEYTITEKTSESQVKPIEPDMNTAALPEEDKTIEPKSEQPTEPSIEIITSESSTAPAQSALSTESTKELVTEFEDQSKQVPESSSTTAASSEVTSGKELIAQPTTEKSVTPEEVSEKIKESSQSTESNDITSQKPIVEAEVTRPGIPGEGNCLEHGQTYVNNSALPPQSPCEFECRCVSSMRVCEYIECSPPPDDLPPNCTQIHSAESCCPIYVCDSAPKVDLQTGNQMSDSHITPADDESKMKPTEKMTEELSTESSKVEEPSQPAATTVQPGKESATPVPSIEGETVSPQVPIESSSADPAIGVRNKEDEEKEPTLPIEPSKGTEEATTAIPEPIETTSQKSSGEDAITPVATDMPDSEKPISEPESQTEKDISESVTEQSEVSGSSEPTKPLEGDQGEYASSTPLPGNNQAPVTIHETTAAPSEGDINDAISGSSEEPTSSDETEVTSPTIPDSTGLSEAEPIGEEKEKPESTESSPVSSSETPIQESTSSEAQESTDSSSTASEKESEEDSSNKQNQDTSGTSPLPEAADITTIAPEQPPSTSSVATEESESTTEGTVSETSENAPKETVESEPSTSAPTTGDESSVTKIKPAEGEEPSPATVQPEVDSPAEASSTMLPVDEATKDSQIPENASSAEPQPEEITEPSKTSSGPSEGTNIESTEAPEVSEKEEPITTAPPLDESGDRVTSSEAPIEKDTESPAESGETKLETTEPSENPEDKKEETVTSVPESISEPEEPSASTAVPKQPSTNDQTSEYPIETPVETPAASSTEGEEGASSSVPGASEEVTTGEPEIFSEEPSSGSNDESVKSVDEKTPETPSGEDSSTEKSSSEPTTDSASSEPSVDSSSSEPAIDSSSTEPAAVEPSSSEPAAIEPSSSEPAIELSSSEPTVPEAITGESVVDEKVYQNESSTPSAIAEEPASQPESTSDISVSSTPESQEQSTKESVPTVQEPVSTASSETPAGSDDNQQIHNTQPQHTEEPTTQEPQNIPEQSTEHSEAVTPHKRPEYPDQTENIPETDDETIFPPEGGNIKDPFETPETDGEDYDGTDEHLYGPGTCRYGGKIYMSAQQIPRDDPCDFCFCFRSDIICLQQSCPPPIPGCHEEPINGFCCPRYECPVSMATSLNITTTTTTTTTTVPPHFLSHAYRGNAFRGGCQVGNRAYRVGEEIKSKSGPCMGCTCGGDGKMKCEPKACSASPMLKEMIAHAAAKRRRR